MVTVRHGSWAHVLKDGFIFVQEPGGDRITTYSRGVEGLVRKPDERRKASRKRKAERIEQAALEQQSHVKRLKNLKKAELVSQLTTLQQAAGHHESAALSKAMQGDFDPEAYDAAMAAAFDQKYYEARCWANHACIQVSVSVDAEHHL